MLKDRRKPWQKTANIKWSRCGTQLAENAARTPDRGPSATVLRDCVRSYGGEAYCYLRKPADLWDVLYALAWSKAWNRPASECLNLIANPEQLEFFDSAPMAQAA